MSKTYKKPVTQDNAETAEQVVLPKLGQKKSASEVAAQHKAKVVNVKTSKAIVASEEVSITSDKISPSTAYTPAPHTKQGILFTLLQKPAGATIDELADATGLATP